MKLVKQPLFFVGIGAFVCAIAVAVVSMVMNPSSSLINKYEKAWNEDDEDLLEECFSSDLTNEELGYAMLDAVTIEYVLAFLEVDADEVEYQYLIGKETETTIEHGKKGSAEEGEDAVEEVNTLVVKVIPTVLLIKEDGEVIYTLAFGKRIIEIDGEEYFYTGYEDFE